MSQSKKKLSSSGHRLGQIIGDWWEGNVLLPLLNEASSELNLFCDNRFVQRKCRGSKIHWKDDEGNNVDYDFVLEVGGTHEKMGSPVAFIESFWRRGARHSKDKARDDTNKLLPMRNTYPSARFLSIAACGEFTEPAREYVRTRLVDLFFIPKNHIIEAFKKHDISIDYPDVLPEKQKQNLVASAEEKLNKTKLNEIGAELRSISGKATFEGYKNRIVAALSALPQEIRIFETTVSKPMTFDKVQKASDFLSNPKFEYSDGEKSYRYEVTFSDGSEFTTDYKKLDYIIRVNCELEALVAHIESLHK